MTRCRRAGRPRTVAAHIGAADIAADCTVACFVRTVGRSHTGWLADSARTVAQRMGWLAAVGMGTNTVVDPSGMRGMGTMVAEDNSGRSSFFFLLTVSPDRFQEYSFYVGCSLGLTQETWARN